MNTRTSPDISVIIPTYNEEQYIRRCLMALSKQKTRFSYEVLIVDHNSTDNTRDIARRFGVRILREKLRGTAVARQTGVEHAKAKILAFTEADCAPPPDWVQTIGNHFEKHSEDVGLTGRYIFDDRSPLINRLILISMALGNYLILLIRGHFPFRGTNAAGKKAVILKAGGFRESGAPFDDADCSMRVAKLGHITYDPTLILTTSSRRIKGRFFSFAWEFLTSSLRVFILKQRGTIQWYKAIR